MTTVLAAVFGVLGCVLLVNLAHLVHARHRSRDREASPTSVSILIPARNEARNLQRLLPTLLEQTLKEIEVVVYDDDSNDDTWQVLSSVDDPRVRAIRGGNLPPGWIGKVHALFRATRVASNDRYLFLDADTALKDERALERLVAQFQTLRPEAVLTGLTRVRGGGQLLACGIERKYWRTFALGGISRRMA
jgi:glycosyltransferase involved in cell wall biosynthesis